MELRLQIFGLDKRDNILADREKGYTGRCVKHLPFDTEKNEFRAAPFHARNGT